MVHVDVRHTCVFHSVQTRLVCYRLLLAMQVWPRQHELPQGCTWSRKLLHEGKTAAIRVRSCGHHDSLQVFILFSLWADNLFIAVTAFSLHGSICVVAAQVKLLRRLEGFVSSSPSTFQQRWISKRERERVPRIQSSHRPEQWFTVRVRNPRPGSHSHAWYTVGFVVIACRDFSPRTVRR